MVPPGRKDNPRGECIDTWVNIRRRNDYSALAYCTLLATRWFGSADRDIPASVGYLISIRITIRLQCSNFTIFASPSARREAAVLTGESGVRFSKTYLVTLHGDDQGVVQDGLPKAPSNGVEDHLVATLNKVLRDVVKKCLDLSRWEQLH